MTPVARTYWKIRLNHNRLWWQYYYDYVYIWTDEPLTPEEIPAEAVHQQMLIDTFLDKVDQVRKITREEYSLYMWE